MHTIFPGSKSIEDEARVKPNFTVPKPPFPISNFFKSLDFYLILLLFINSLVY